MESGNHHHIKIEHFKNIVAIAFADGLLDVEEKKFLSAKAEEFQLSPTEIEKIMTNSHTLKFEIPVDEVEREEQLIDAIYLSMVNGELSLKEYNLCLDIGYKLGFTDKDIANIIALVKKLWGNKN